MENNTNKPDGIQLYKTLLALYAEQEGITIKCQIKHGDEIVDFDTSEFSFTNNINFTTV